jgi:hypothetical protein
MGSASYSKEDAQALANKIVAVAEARKDALAFISPYRAAAITDTTDDRAAAINSDSDITDNVLSFYCSYLIFILMQYLIVVISTCMTDLQTLSAMFL